MNPILISKNNCQNAKQSPSRVFLLAAGATILIATGFCTSCATTRGFGQDVEKTGDKIQDAASR